MKPGLTPVPTTATRALGQRVDLLRHVAVAPDRIRQLLGRGHDRHFQLEDRLELRQDLLERRAGAEDRDVRTHGLDGARDVVGHFHLEPAPDPADLAQVATGLGGIDIDGADNRQALAGRHLPDDARADGPESDMHHFDTH